MPITPQPTPNGYSRETAKQLYGELQETLARLPSMIDSADEHGPVLRIISDGLLTAIVALKTTIRP